MSSRPAFIRLDSAMIDGALLPTWLIMSVWLGYGFLGFYFAFSRDLQRKRRLWRPYVIGSGVLFLGVMVAMGFPFFVLPFAAPFVALITYLNLRRGLRLCEQCGATVWSVVPFAKSRYCTRCGAPLDSSVS